MRCDVMRETKSMYRHAIFCNATCDGYLCWPSTLAGETVFQYCPNGRFSNQEKCAFRRCSAEGLWLGRHLNDSRGWTNYTPCFPPLVQKMLGKVNGDEAAAQFKFETAANTRIIEMVGIVSSFLTICASIFIFNAFPSLHNRRTVIHRHLFYALLMEMIVRMVLYTQQSYSFDGVEPREEGARKGIEYFPYVCEGAYVLLEYSPLVVYAWMFIEGIFLNTLISANTLRNEIPINYFYIGGWGGPALLITVWATVVGRHYSNEPYTCWYGYNYLPSYYIIRGPILAIIAINMLFLGTIMSVIIMKLRRTNDSELRKIQKTIRATIILLPLLGIINIFNLFDYPLDGSSTGFAVWAYFTHFFRSFQGVLISFIYCFSNGEVRKAIKKKFERRTWFRFEFITRRRIVEPLRPRERPIFAIADNDNMELVPMPMRIWTRTTSTHMTSDVEAGPSQSDAMGEQEGYPRPPMVQPPRVRSRSLSIHVIPEMEAGPSHMRSMPAYEDVDEGRRPIWVLQEPGTTHMIWDVRRHSNPRTLSVYMPVDELLQININRRASDETHNGARQSRPHHRTDSGHVRRSSADIFTSHARATRQYDCDAYALRHTFDESAPAYPKPSDLEQQTMRRPSENEIKESSYPPLARDFKYEDMRRYSEELVANPQCPVHSGFKCCSSGRSSSGIPSIPPSPRRNDNSEVVSPVSTDTQIQCCCCKFSCDKPRRSSMPDKAKFPKDVKVQYPGTEFNPFRVIRSSSEARIPQDANNAAWRSTIPRRARRDVFVRPGLVTKDSRAKSFNSCL